MEAFQHLIQLRQSFKPNEIHIIEAEKERLEIWANNIGALQESFLESSLESRLQKDEDARAMVLKLLDRCKASLEEGLGYRRMSIND